MYDRPITMGLDRLVNPTAKAWPSAEAQEKARADKWDDFIHPARGK